MRRREFIGVLGGAVWSLHGRAQQLTIPVIGFLGTTGRDDFIGRVVAFREGLKESGYIEGENVLIEYRWAEGNYDRLAELAADLVGRRVAVIAAVGGEPSPLAARSATSTIPIVFILGTDPVKLGLVANLNRPDGNITGVSFFQSELGAKRLGLLRDLLPKASAVGMLINPNYPEAENHASDMQRIGLALGLQIQVVRVSAADEFDSAFSKLAQHKIDALVLANDAYFLSQRGRLIELAARYAMPAIYFWREFVVDGGLMSYSPSLAQGYRQVGTYTGKILKGAKPSDLPVLQPTKFEFVVTSSTAKSLGLAFPPALLAVADEIIE
jgi:putative tryptophan/tyrosine transport system substrate-binding protein